MRLESARELKASLKGELRERFVTRQGMPRAAQVVPTALPPRRPRAPLALGITARGSDGYLVALRVRELTPGIQALAEHVRRRTRGDVDVRLVGRIVKQVVWHRRRNRGLRIGGSVGHVSVTAGTLGCFVRPRGTDGEEHILSNNHVLADENRARTGDRILQPGAADGGRAPRDVVGALERTVPLRRWAANITDAATAELTEGLSYYYNWIEGRGELRGVRADPAAIGERVYKVGRTTGLTEGRVSAVEMDDVLVTYDMGDLIFDNQIEIEPASLWQPFSLGGDSGSLIVDGRGRALALLFAGNDADTTYANPIGDVLEALKVDLVF